MPRALLAFALTVVLLNPLVSFAQESSRATYVPVPLTADLDHLSQNQREMIALLISAADDMDAVFWLQAFGDKAPLLEGLSQRDREFAEINYGPWDRLNADQSFVEGIPSKPEGANLYPHDMTREEFEQHLENNPADEEAFKSLYTLIRRDEDGGLIAVPYSEAFQQQFSSAAGKLRKAAELAEDPGFKAYLLARADALVTNEYQESDMLWMDMKSNEIDVVIGPIENYEDKLNGYKAAAECYVLIKDMSWSERLSRYAGMLPDLQRGLPVDDEYKAEEPGSNSDLNAYDVIYYAGDCNAGSKTIAINLPNDEEVQLQKGSRRLQLKNAMQAKFDQILVPIADLLIVEDQRKHITFNAFFSNTMFHEVAHGLGIKNTITGNGSVRSALRESASALEEGKADILGLYMITELMEQGELTEGELEDYYVTFMAGIFRSVRFGASSAHGKANMLRFNFFKEMNAFTREESGQYRVNMPEMKQAMEALSRRILELQGNGDYDAARSFADEMGYVGPELAADLERVNREGIPTDIVFEQGLTVLGLEE
ncbi:MAG: Zn-dependent hydrolase [Planctomycetota bacterium]